MVRFVKNIWNEYPIPKEVSVWNEGTELADLIGFSLEELRSHLFLTAFLTAHSQVTHMPSNCRNIVSVRMAQGFQGNTFVKKTYDEASKTLYLRYFPAIVRYHKDITLDDLGTLSGDRLIFFKSYIQMKMASKEITVITSIKLDADNGEVNVDDLKEFLGRVEKTYLQLKDEIIIYSAS